MRHLAFSLLLALCTVMPAHALDLRVALVASASQLKQAPESSVPGDRERGLNAMSAELTREICRRIGAQCRFDYVSLKDVLPGVSEGRYQMGMGIFLRTPERDKLVNFSDSIATTSSRLLATPARAAAFSGKTGSLSLANLRDARMVAVAGSVYEDYLKQIAAAQRLTVISVASREEILPLLVQGEADFWLAPVYAAYFLIGEEFPAKFQFYGPPEVANGLGGTVHVALTKGDTALTGMVNKALAEMRVDGSYHRIVRQYFPVSLD